MNETELLREIALRAEVPESTGRAVLETLRDLARQGRVAEDVLASPTPAPRDPFRAPDPRDARLVEALISTARVHPLGVEFLEHGYLGSVAAEFGAHAFTVEEARRRLKERA